MFFLLRTCFYLAIVVALIPVNPADLRPDQRPVSTLETISIARVVLRDLAGFCNRNPQACAAGRELAAQFGAKAKAGARFAATVFAGDDGAIAERARSDNMKTGAVTR